MRWRKKMRSNQIREHDEPENCPGRFRAPPPPGSPPSPATPYTRSPRTQKPNMPGRNCPEGTATLRLTRNSGPGDPEFTKLCSRRILFKFSQNSIRGGFGGGKPAQ